jgi:glutamate 5-kinase
MKKTVILKLGSTTLTRGTAQISRGKLEDVARQVLALQSGYRFIIVTSGAIAMARQFIQLHGGNTIAVKQALAAIGQPALMKAYQEVFNDFGLPTAQCLIVNRDLDNDRSRENITNTINVLLDNGYIPIINENDTVATEEIRFGDNDKLSALTAAVLRVDLLVLASDISGLYDKDPHKHPDAAIIPLVENLNDVAHLGGETNSDIGTGGMRSKLVAAGICAESHVEMWIVNGFEDGFLVKALAGEVPFTRFVPQMKPPVAIEGEGRTNLGFSL